MGPRLREDDEVTSVSFHALLIVAILAADFKAVIPAQAATHGTHPEAV
jgi:hypothetical protein